MSLRVATTFCLLNKVMLEVNNNLTKVHTTHLTDEPIFVAFFHGIKIKIWYQSMFSEMSLKIVWSSEKFVAPGTVKTFRQFRMSSHMAFHVAFIIKYFSTFFTFKFQWFRVFYCSLHNIWMYGSDMLFQNRFIPVPCNRDLYPTIETYFVNFRIIGMYCSDMLFRIDLYL